ncbi:MAG: outer-membrane lipoprotein carrier protein LolA, partial [Hylemonella sp.]|nr:outer-membrane lipoprotein carrier protein LolA [Hylemonella sp.]
LKLIRVGFRSGARGAELAVLEIHDNFGQRSVLSFSQVEVNPRLASDVFRFKAPAGADVIRQ